MVIVVDLVVVVSISSSSSSELKWFEIIYVSVLLIKSSAAEPSVVGVSEPGGGRERTLRAPWISSSVISWYSEKTMFHSSCSRTEAGGDDGFLEVDDDGWLLGGGGCSLLWLRERVSVKLFSWGR